MSFELQVFDPPWMCWYLQPDAADPKKHVKSEAAVLGFDGHDGLFLAADRKTGTILWLQASAMVYDLPRSMKLAGYAPDENAERCPMCGQVKPNEEE